MTLALTALSSVWPLNRIWFSVVAIRGTVTHQVTDGHTHGHTRSRTVSRSGALLHTRSHMVSGVTLMSVRSQGSRDIHQVTAHGPAMWLKPWRR